MHEGQLHALTEVGNSTFAAVLGILDCSRYCVRSPTSVMPEVL